MPNYRTHLCIGAAVASVSLVAHATLFSPLSHFAEYFLYIGLTLLGSLFPDIDTYSRIQRICMTITLLSLSIAIMYEKLYQAFFCLAFLLFMIIIPHRSTTHQPRFFIGFPIALSAYFSFCYPEIRKSIITGALFFILGSLSHVIADRKITAFKRRIKRFRKRHIITRLFR